MTNEIIQYALLGLIILWLIILEIHFKDVKWRMSNLFQTWDDIIGPEGDITKTWTDEDVKTPIYRFRKDRPNPKKS